MSLLFNTTKIRGQSVVLVVRSVELHRHVQHKLRGGHDKAQHSRERGVQEHQVTQHILPSRHLQGGPSGLLLHRQEIQVSEFNFQQTTKIRLPSQLHIIFN